VLNFVVFLDTPLPPCVNVCYFPTPLPPSEWKKHNLNEYWKYIVLKICHVLNAKTPPSPTVTLCVKWLPYFNTYFLNGPLLFLHFFESICNILVTGHLDSGLPTWNRQVMSVYQYFTWAFIIQKCFAQLFSNYILAL